MIGWMELKGLGKLHTKSGDTVAVTYHLRPSADGYTGSVTQIETAFEIPNDAWNITLEDGRKWTFQKYNDIWDKVAFIDKG